MTQVCVTDTEPIYLAAPRQPPVPSVTRVEPAWKWATVALALAASFGGVFGGPPLGDHEAIVAECARKMRLSGDWLVPQFLETAFIRKSPLPVWLVAGTSYLFGNDPVTGLPVTAAGARLPSALCAFMTTLILWRLGSRMFGSRAGLVAAQVSSSSVAFLLYAPNATAEMPLTCCCVWAYAHFWFAVRARTKLRRFGHGIGFYFALGMAMLAKGPVPIVLVGFPLAVWWFVHRPLRIIARRGLSASCMAITSLLRDLAARATGVFTKLWFIPGILVFALVFIPWMLAVAERHPFAWDLWNWQYLQRAKGDYPDTRHRSVAYYVPIVAGLSLPWTFLAFEGAVAPWLRRYAHIHKPLLFAGLWAFLGTFSMSLMEFKKTYYILPSVPGLLLLMGVVAEHVLCRTRRGQLALGTMALVTVTVFHFGWNGIGTSLGDMAEVRRLASTLDSSGIPTSARLLWADQRPDARLSFYFNRRSEHMIDAEEILARGILNRRTDKSAIEQMAIARGMELLQGPEPVYLIIGRENYLRIKNSLGQGVQVVGAADELAKSTGGRLLVVTNSDVAASQ